MTPEPSERAQYRFFIRAELERISGSYVDITYPYSIHRLVAAMQYYGPACIAGVSYAYIG